jgi:CHASE2 domain-containing sensor protein
MKEKSKHTDQKHQAANACRDNAEAGKDLRHFLQYYFPRQFLWVLLISVGVTWFEEHRVIVEMQSWSLDLFLKHSAPVSFDDVYIVYISDADYRDPDMFKAQSPLDAQMVVDLIRAVASLNPKLIGVDLDTKDSSWSLAIDKNCSAKNSTLRFAPPSKPTLVLARMPVESKIQPKSSGAEKPIQLYQLVGGSEGCSQALYGVPRFLLDADGVVRRYVGKFDIDGENPKESFARVIVENFTKAYQSSRGMRILNFAAAHNPDRGISAAQLCAVAGQGHSSSCAQEAKEVTGQDLVKAEGWRDAVLNKGKIVLIGGAFEDARDAYLTPIGTLHGVDLNALAIDSDLHPGAIDDAPWPYGLAGDLVMGTLIAWIFWHFEGRPTLALLLSTFGVGFGSLLISWLLLQVVVWLSFIPVLVGVNIHQYFEHLHKTWHAGKGR